MQKTWTVNVNGTDHTVEYTFSKWTNKRILLVDGVQRALDPTSIKVFVGVDHPLVIDGRQCQLIQMGSTADLAVDGVFLDSKVPYQPLKTPWWGWIFVVLSFSLVAMGGAIPAALAIVGAYSCAQKSADPVRPTARRVLSCAGTTLLVWFIAIAVALIVNIILASAA